MSKARQSLGEVWADFLPKADELLAPVYKQLKEELAVGYTMHPEKKNVFRVFRELTPDKIRVIWLGQDPYNTPVTQATGRAFECGAHPSPSMRKISEVYRKEVPDYDHQVVAGTLDKWVANGVFLLNKALTVRHGMPNSHTKLWEPFTRYVISSLINDISTPKAIILLGAEAQKMVGREALPHKIFVFEHPAASSYQGRAWKGDGLFTETQKFLSYVGYDFHW